MLLNNGVIHKHNNGGIFLDGMLYKKEEPEDHK